MASETPGGDRPKRRVAALDTRSTDKTYRSGDVSTVKPVAVDSTVRPGQKPAPAKPLRRVDPKSTDKYYADLSLPAPPRRPAPVRSNPVTRAQRAARPAARPTAVPEPTSAAGDIIRKVEDIRPVLDEAIARIRAGAEGTVYVDASLMMRATSVLDSLMTRTQITEDERYAVRLVSMLAGQTVESESDKAAEPFHPIKLIAPVKVGSVATPPKPTSTKEAVTDEDIGDTLAFLNSEAAEDPIVDTSAVSPAEVKEVTDEDDNDFLRDKE